MSQLFTLAVVNRPSDENNRVQGDPFSRGIILYDSWGIRLHGGYVCTFRLIRPDQSEYAISKGGPHYTCMGDRLFRDNGNLIKLLVSVLTL